jgi:hypothetical protein
MRTLRTTPIRHPRIRVHLIRTVGTAVACLPAATAAADMPGRAGAAPVPAAAEPKRAHLDRYRQDHLPGGGGR